MTLIKFRPVGINNPPDLMKLPEPITVVPIR